MNRKGYGYRSPKGKLNGTLYTAPRQTMTDREYMPRSQQKKPGAGIAGQKARSAISALGNRLQKSGGRRRRSSFRRRANTDVGARRFYIFVAAACVLVMLAALLLSSFVLAPEGDYVTVVDEGRAMSARTTARTVGEFLSRNNVAVGEGDFVDVDTDQPVVDGMQITIRRAMPVSIVNGSAGTQEVRMLAGTVGEALERSGIQVGEQDEVYPSRDSYITSGMAINIVNVEYETVTQTEKIYYKEVTKNDPSLAQGKSILQTKGENGLLTKTVTITYKNGVEVSRKVTKEEVTKAAVDEVVLVGTYVAPTPTPRPAATPAPAATKAPSATKAPGSSSKPASTKKPSATKKPTDTGKDNEKDDTGKLTKLPSVNQIHSGTWSEHKSVPAPAASLIKKTIVMNSVTAYKATGRRTATGTWPRIGTVAADPKQLPYGTKLYIPGYGYARVEDTGSNKHADDYYCIDVFLNSDAECRQWGRKRDLKVYVLS